MVTNPEKRHSTASTIFTVTCLSTLSTLLLYKSILFTLTVEVALFAAIAMTFVPHVARE